MEHCRKEPGAPIGAWCKSKGLNAAYTSQVFADHGRILAGQILSQNSSLAAQRLAALALDKNKEISLKASTSLLDRAGHSPQATIINLNNSVTAAFQIAPLFKENYGKDVASFLEDTTGSEAPSTDSGAMPYNDAYKAQDESQGIQSVDGPIVGMEQLDPQGGGQTPTQEKKVPTQPSVDFSSPERKESLESIPESAEPKTQDLMQPLGIEPEEAPKPPDPVQALTGKQPKPEPTVEHVIDLLERAAKSRHGKHKAKVQKVKPKKRRK